MGIFEKALQKAAKDSGDAREHEHYDDNGNLIDLTEYPDEETGELPPAEMADSRQGEATDEQPPLAEMADSLKSEGPGHEVKLDLSGLIESGLVDPRSNQVNHTTEEFRRIKRPLLMHVTGKGASVVPNANMIMVTGHWPGRGRHSLPSTWP